MTESTSITRAAELFSCAGGMAAGFRRAGIEFERAIDASADACVSYQRNLGHAPWTVDVGWLARHPGIGGDPGYFDLVVADPPCTPWSRAGKREGLADERDCLEVTRDLILAWRPRAYLIGNVPGLDDARHLPTVRALLAPLARAGYCVTDFARLDAADHGVPQHRVRPFWFGHLGGPCISWPRPTHCDPRALASGCLFESERLAPWVTCRESLSVLPRDEWGEPLCRYRAHKKHPPSRPDEPSHTITSEQRSVGGGVLEWPWDRPATTVYCRPEMSPPACVRRPNGRRGSRTDSGFSSHPLAIRLSERAAAVLQGFPPDWYFHGTSRRARWQQIGQAMPPGLAAAVAGSIRDWFTIQTREA